MASCPTVKELVDGVKSLTRKEEGTFQTAWKDSFTDPHHCCEQGGFIYIDYPVPTKVTRAWVTWAPKGVTMNQRTSGPNAAIDLNKPGIAGNKVILAANFHTHPLSSEVGGDPQPSRSDYTNAYARGVPGIIVSRDGVYAYGPENRTSVTNPKGYPGPVKSPAVPSATLVERDPPPWVVPNQWPEGTGAAVASDLSEDDVDGDAGENVTLVEWSDEGVEYGEELVDGED